jgi:YbbR domain-containing protein
MKKVGAWLARWFTQYPHYKLASLLIATGLWLVQRVAHNPIKEVTREVPVQVINLPEGWDILNAPKRVDLHLRGPSMLLERALPRISAQIDVKGLQPGWHEVPIVPQRTLGLQVQQVDPPTAVVTLDEVATKQFEIRYMIRGSTAPGYEYEPPSFNPPKVTLTGLKGSLGRVRQARVYVDVSGAERDFQERLVVWPVDDEGRSVNDVKVEPSSTIVTVHIRRQKEPKTVPIKVDVQGQPAQGYTFGTISVSPSTVTLWGQPENLADIEFVKTEPLDISGARSTVSRSLNLHLPPGVEAMDVEKAVVEVEIRRAEGSRTP